ncbi:MAG: hypothetical protein HY466_00960 [Deltaproteobacteria bacterium]|nr:hypothetical protein [Deltaproteobacteria bacterium]
MLRFYGYLGLFLVFGLVFLPASTLASGGRLPDQSSNKSKSKKLKSDVDIRVTGSLVATTCGNGWLEEGEQCDDRNQASGDGCNSNCTSECSLVVCGPPECGNGIHEPGEECDDGNLSNGDDCDNGCRARCTGWRKTIDSGYGYATDVEVDRENNVYVLGAFVEGSTDWWNRIWVAKFGPGGNRLWTFRGEGNAPRIDIIEIESRGGGLALDESRGVLYIAGTADHELYLNKLDMQTGLPVWSSPVVFRGLTWRDAYPQGRNIIVETDHNVLVIAGIEHHLWYDSGGSHYFYGDWIGRFDEDDGNLLASWDSSLILLEPGIADGEGEFVAPVDSVLSGGDLYLTGGEYGLNKFSVSLGGTIVPAWDFTTRVLTIYRDWSILHGRSHAILYNDGSLWLGGSKGTRRGDHFFDVPYVGRFSPEDGALLGDIFIGEGIGAGHVSDMFKSGPFLYLTGAYSMTRADGTPIARDDGTPIAGRSAIWVAKVNSESGALVWEEKINSVEGEGFAGEGFALDRDTRGNLYVVGRFDGLDSAPSIWIGQFCGVAPSFLIMKPSKPKIDPAAHEKRKFIRP